MEILLDGQSCLFDAVDAERVSAYAWGLPRYRPGFHAVADTPEGSVWMHRLIMGAMLGRKLERREEVDHINRNGLDNRRVNLRLATHSQNVANQRRRPKGASARKGVTVCKAKYHAGRPHHVWAARIRVEGRETFLGCFRTEDEAAAAYDAAALAAWGEFAMTNEMLDVLLETT